MWWAVTVACVVGLASSEWRCPVLSARPAAECACDLPRTLRCAGDITALQIIGRHLREQKARYKSSAVSLLDISLRGVTSLTSVSITEIAGVGIHGLVISSGEIRRVQQGAFDNVANTLLALGLPNNQLPSVPTEGLSHLPKLDRLDLSNNKIHILEANSLKGIQNISFLDISDNQLTDISPETFVPLNRLSVLRLRGNLLKVVTLTSLKKANLLKELDLSSNALEGPVGPNTLPSLSYLTTLHLADNTFASIRRGALAGLTNLTHLNLHNNQIDVLEDNAFRHLLNLTHLDLSHNEIVAVSGASLAQLSNLAHLDLSHNFLRSVYAEPLKSLTSLTELLYHDNEITMIDDGALASHKGLTRFTIEDNPLNCDCQMASFARWLREAINLSPSDKSAAICTTPPHLEGALLSRLSKNKLCDDIDKINEQKDESVENVKVLKNTLDASQENFPHSGLMDDYDDKSDGLDDDLYEDELDVPSEDDLPISKSQVRLLDSWYDDEEVYLSWAVDPPSTRRYRCTGVTASRSGGLPKHVACHRAAPANIILKGLKIDPGEYYAFCIALEEMDTREVPMALVLGCAAPQLVRQREPFVTAIPVIVSTPREIDFRVSEVRSNITSDGLLSVHISVTGLQPSRLSLKQQKLSPSNHFYPNCYVVIAVLLRSSLVAQKDIPCKSKLEVLMDGFLRGPYEVCASVSKFKSDGMRTICVVPQHLEPIGSEMKSGFQHLDTALVGIALGLVVVILVLICFVRKMLKQPSTFQGQRCFRQEQVVEENTRASYVMLTATSKV